MGTGLVFIKIRQRTRARGQIEIITKHKNQSKEQAYMLARSSIFILHQQHSQAPGRDDRPKNETSQKLMYAVNENEQPSEPSQH